MQIYSIEIEIDDKVYNHQQILAILLGVGGRLTVTFLVAEESPLSL